MMGNWNTQEETLLVLDALICVCRFKSYFRY